MKPRRLQSATIFSIVTTSSATSRNPSGDPGLGGEMTTFAPYLQKTPQWR